MGEKSYRDRVAIVTGASSGIGWETARAFARRGAIVVGVARREERLVRLGEELRRHSPASSHLCGDLGSQAFAERVVRETVAHYGRLDVLVNNAGMPKHKHVFHLSGAEAEQVTRVNFLSAVWTTLAAIPPMLAQGGGSIVNVSSFAAVVTPPREAIYAGTKAAMNAFTEGLWSDLRGTGIHTAIVNPGPIDTEIWQKQEEPTAYHGPLYPPGIVVDAVFEAIEKRRFEITVPRRSAPLVAARVLRLLAPGLLRFGMHRMDPVPKTLIDTAQARARGDGS
jgi:short-subunit dehydrogenase